MTIPFEDPEPKTRPWWDWDGPVPGLGRWRSSVEADLIAATRRLYLTDQPQQLARATDFGNLVITVAWPADPRQERDDDPPLC